MEGRTTVSDPSGQSWINDYRHGVYFNEASRYISTVQEEASRRLLLDCAEIYQVFRRYEHNVNLVTQEQVRPEWQRHSLNLQTYGRQLLPNTTHPQFSI